MTTEINNNTRSEKNYTHNMIALHHLQQRRAPVGLCRVTLQKILKLPNQEASNRLLTEGILRLGLGPTFARIVQFRLTLSLPECLMEFCTVT